MGGAALGLTLYTPDALACGCFTPPDPSVPVVQAGERIAFAQSNGQVTAHIQIQYSGNAQDFGWLLPLPSVPTLQLGVDELFNQLTATTQPKYKLNRVYEGNCSFDPSRFGGLANGGGAATPTAGGASGGDASSQSPLVIQDSIGPYDYAVLKADSKDAMLKWLSDNHYFVPVGTDDSVGPYIHTGAYFLALKLKSGASTGDLQPVVVNYASDLPMIPIVLTSTGAKPDMGIQVWMLGGGRAIPRNYFHTVINDAKIDWLNAGQNYNDVIIAATHEADGRHTFVTEYAGSSSVMKNILNAPGRFGVQGELASQPDVVSFVNYLNGHGFPQTNLSAGPGGGAGVGPGPYSPFAYSSQLLGILQKYVPVPPGLAQKGVTPSQFYADIGYYLSSYQQQNPQDFTGWTMSYQPTMMAQEIWDRVVTPTLQAGALFDNFSYLTRLYTTLSPEDMNKDPVFSWNPGLPDYANVHNATLTYHCGYFGRSNQSDTPATLLTEEGWTLQFPYGTGTQYPDVGGPASEKIEILSEEGPPQVVQDNDPVIPGSLPHNSGGCGVALGSRATETAGGLLLFTLVGGALVFRRRRAE
jgi:hypothetical protein